MRKTCIYILLAGFLTVLLGMTAACDTAAPGLTVVTGSGKLQTSELDIAGFTRIDINNAFLVDITRADSFLVSITCDDNLVDYLDVGKSGDTLRIRLKPNTSYVKTTQKAKINLPALAELEVDGAGRATLTGFSSSHAADFYLSGAGSLKINDMKAGNATFETSGAARISGTMQAADTRFILSGASNVEIEGSAADASIKVSGASRLDLSEFTLNNADVDVSGGSTAVINASGKLDMDVSGLSRLTYIGQPDIGRQSVSGGSIIEQK